MAAHEPSHYDGVNHEIKEKGKNAHSDLGGRVRQLRYGVEWCERTEHSLGGIPMAGSHFQSQILEVFVSFLEFNPFIRILCPSGVRQAEESRINTLSHALPCAVVELGDLTTQRPRVQKGDSLLCESRRGIHSRYDVNNPG